MSIHQTKPIEIGREIDKSNVFVSDVKGTNYMSYFIIK